MTRGHLNPRQVHQLLQPVNPSRVLKDGKGKSHLSQQDVTAHLTRIFGFGNYDLEVLGIELVFETPRDEQGVKWDVCYKAHVRLTIRNEHGDTVATYEDVSTGFAQNQKRGDAHDLSQKSAVSLAKKRATINLGDQFGLSLYNGGQTTPLVMGTLVNNPNEAENQTQEPQGDVQQGVPEQVAMGDVDPESHVPEPRDPADVQDSLNRAGGQQ